MKSPTLPGTSPCTNVRSKPPHPALSVLINEHCVKRAQHKVDAALPFIIMDQVHIHNKTQTGKNRTKYEQLTS